MKSTNKTLYLKLFVLLISVSISVSWGIVGHERINKAAVLLLPKPLQLFFYNHIDFITQEATVPDIRKHTLKYKDENPRHYMDVENFGAWDSIPRNFEEVQKKHDAKFLASNGILPWYINEMTDKLTQAFKDKDRAKILFLAADLGHYIADAHMPLHTSANHDGQLTNQKGIHALWESRLPELFAKNYMFTPKPIQYIENIHAHTWDMIAQSHQLVTPLLSADKQLRTSLPENQIFKMDDKGQIEKSKYNAAKFSDLYALQLHNALNGMVESQLKKAAAELSNYWYTAWVNAGKPDVSTLDANELSHRNAKALKKDLKIFTKGQLFGFKNQDD